MTRTDSYAYYFNRDDRELIAKALTAYKEELKAELRDGAVDLEEHNRIEMAAADEMASVMELDAEYYQPETAEPTQASPPRHPSAQCTPGPWKVAGRFEPEHEPPYILIKGPGNLPMGEAQTKGSLMASEYYDPHIAKVIFDRTEDHGEQLANASAIAALPELTAKLSLLIRTVWDTFRHRESKAQWDSLESCTKEAAALLSRIPHQT